MIRHYVLVCFADGTPQSEIDGIFTELGALQDKIGGILDYGFGPNVSPEEPVVHGFKQAFWFDFKDAASRDRYLEDPDHKKAGARLVTAAKNGLDGLIVLDLEL